MHKYQILLLVHKFMYHKCRLPSVFSNYFELNKMHRVMILVEVKICMSPQLTKILVKDVLNKNPVLSGTNCPKF